MQITRQADYAVRAVLYLAQLGVEKTRCHQPDCPRTTNSPSFLAKIVSQLSVAGLLQTSRGARGGVALARSPEEISLLEVVEAIDGPILLNECVASSGVCTFGEGCPMRPIWCDAQAELVTRLKLTTFKEFLGNGKAAPTAA